MQENGVGLLTALSLPCVLKRKLVNGAFTMSDSLHNLMMITYTTTGEKGYRLDFTRKHG